MSKKIKKSEDSEKITKSKAKEISKKTSKKVEKTESDNDTTLLENSNQPTDKNIKEAEVNSNNDQPVNKTKVEFNWDSIIQSDGYTESQRTELAKEYENTLTEVLDKQVIDGKVVAITDREVVVDINFKSDGVISFNEFKYNNDLKIEIQLKCLLKSKKIKMVN